MKITSIKQQQKLATRYSIFLDGKYTFSLSETALLESKLVRGQELSAKEVEKFKKQSGDDKLYYLALSYVAMRPRTKWEIETYLQRKKASPTLFNKILNKLRDIDLINDEKYAQAFVNDRKLLRPTSKRKLVLELRQKRVADDIIQSVLVGQEPQDEQNALNAAIASKRRQSKYQDDLKLMQYLARQGYSYTDIKEALGGSEK